MFLGAKSVDKFPTVEFPPQCLDPIPPALGDRAEKSVLQRLEQGAYTALSKELFTLELQEAIASQKKEKQGDHEASLTRVKTGHVDIPEAGSWDVFRDTVRVRCGGRAVEVMNTKIENPASTRVRLWEPEAGWILVGYSASWALEGDSGGLFQVALVVPKTCKVHRSDLRRPR